MVREIIPVCHLCSHQTLLGKSLDVVKEKIICKKSQGKGDNSVCHLCSYQTLLGKFLDIVQEEMLYVKSQKGREIIHFVTYTVIRHCLSSL